MTASTDTPTAASGPGDRSDRDGYDLRFTPDSTSPTARANLVDILQRELLGPSRGDDEVIDQSPDVVYLVGRIAPTKLLRLPAGAKPASDLADEPGTDGPVEAGVEAALEAESLRLTDIGDDLEAKAGRGVPVTGLDGETGSDDDGVEDHPVRRGLMIPASMGLRFQIPDDLDSVTVHASWGTYEPLRGEHDETTGSPLRRYQRIPVDVTTTVHVADLIPGQTHAVPLRDHVVLRIDSHHEPQTRRRIIEIALCNDQKIPQGRIPVGAWLFQTRLTVDAQGRDVFLPVRDPLVAADAGLDLLDDDDSRLTLLYRDRLEYGVGRTCSADWRVDDPASRRASAVWTTWLPTAETPQVAAPPIEGALLDMRRLARATPADLEAGLRPIVDGYTAFLDDQAARVPSLPDHLAREARYSLQEARQVLTQLREGLDHLLTDVETQRCFAFMNRVMADQRIRTQVAARRAEDPTLSPDHLVHELEGDPRSHSWRAFQLAFILLQLPALADPAHRRRSSDVAKVELLFFPTGGGKTEAYLGLAAFTFAVRRRQGVVDSADGPLDGGNGVAVLMRYTLRLLTSQQFQRATALVCAAELARREDEATWGSEPFLIGLWVGTDVSPKRFDEVDEQLRNVNEGRGHRLTVLQVQRCPWCGTRITPADVRADSGQRRVYVYCGDQLGDCPFAQGGSARDGLPMLTVDEEIYRLAPSFVIATVDKFARLAREGEAASLFGYVSQRCARHGYIHRDYPSCDLKDGSKHQARNGLPPAAVSPTPRLRPPDLIIQDELHLITGSLGTNVGLFEVAVDLLSSWTTRDGRPVKPLIIASSATVRNARDQVQCLYGRGVTIFPPQVLDVSDTYFARELAISQAPGRRYLGISASGVRLTAAEIRVAEVAMAGAQLLLDREAGSTTSSSTPSAASAGAPPAADPYLTLVGYFSATRELAGMARYLGDDIETTLKKGLSWTGLPRRFGTDFGHLHVAELTSRISGADITATLDAMTVPFDATFDSTSGRGEIIAKRKAEQPVPARPRNPFDVILATSMLQVGVDVTRLGLMLVVGQPKNTAEYIQASSRVGRDGQRPGLVLSLGNWARPRDLAHFEQFRHYHDTFYARVEPLSVTPFSATSIDRGMEAVLVSAARVMDAVRRDRLSPEIGAGRVDVAADWLDDLVERLCSRIATAADAVGAEQARRRLRNRLDTWHKRRDHLAARHLGLVYERVTDGSRHGALMASAETAARAGTGTTGAEAPPFVVANSMREVQPEINLLVSPLPDQLFRGEVPGTPQWQMPTGSAS